jgi:hypothetical protein
LLIYFAISFGIRSYRDNTFAGHHCPILMLGIAPEAWKLPLPTIGAI